MTTNETIKPGDRVKLRHGAPYNPEFWGVECTYAGGYVTVDHDPKHPAIKAYGPGRHAWKGKPAWRWAAGCQGHFERLPTDEEQFFVP